MGSADFAVPSLVHCAGHHELLAVYSQPPRPSGRGQKLTATPVAEMATELGYQLHTPLNFKDNQEISRIKSLSPDFLIVVAYGLILPQALLSIPRIAPINAHASLLPRWRGAAPIERAIEAGDELGGITLQQMVVGLDEGAILAQKPYDFADKTAPEARADLAVMAGALLGEAFAGSASASLRARKIPALPIMPPKLVKKNAPKVPTKTPKYYGANCALLRVMASQFWHPMAHD